MVALFRPPLAAPPFALMATGMAFPLSWVWVRCIAANNPRFDDIIRLWEFGPVESYAIWNNKGGTGKSTITFHIASRFAELHSNRNVLVVDMCPQANSSMLLLGGGVAGESNLLGFCSLGTPKSVVGYLSDAILSRSVPTLTSYSIQVSTVNNKISSNLYRNRSHPPAVRLPASWGCWAAMSPSERRRP